MCDRVCILVPLIALSNIYGLTVRYLYRKLHALFFLHSNKAVFMAIPAVNQGHAHPLPPVHVHRPEHQAANSVRNPPIQPLWTDDYATTPSSGYVMETRTKTLTGRLIYSDRVIDPFYMNSTPPTTCLNGWAWIPVLGIAAGIVRTAIATIHIIGHLFAALFTFDKGHLFHAAKGGCEFLRGLIEATPFIGREFAMSNRQYWIIKIYNPDSPDGLDKYWNNWTEFKQNRPTGYITG